MPNVQRLAHAFVGKAVRWLLLTEIITFASCLALNDSESGSVEVCYLIGAPFANRIDAITPPAFNALIQGIAVGNETKFDIGQWRALLPQYPSLRSA